MSEEILPCPHCAGTEIHFTNHGRIGRALDHRGDTVWSMCCYNCGATFPNMYNKEGLVAKWNRRVTPAAPQIAEDALYTMDQMREYADNFYLSQLQILVAEKEAYERHSPQSQDEKRAKTMREVAQMLDDSPAHYRVGDCVEAVRQMADAADPLLKIRYPGENK